MSTVVAAITANQSERDVRIRLAEEHINAENDHDMNRIIETFGNDSRFFLNGTKLEGHDSIRACYESFGFGNSGYFSEIKAEPKTWHIGDESITLELSLSGIHTGEFQGIAPTGKRFEVSACAIFCYDEEGKLESERVYFDMNSIINQLKAI